MHNVALLDRRSVEDTTARTIASLRHRVAELERELAAARRQCEGCPVTVRMGQVVSAWGLTPAQARVLELTVQGRSNQEIADELQIQEGTVEAHLTRIFRKSRTASRGELMYSFWSTRP